MKFIKFIFSFTCTVALTWALNTKLGVLPPLGKFLDPFGGFWQNIETEALSMSKEISISGLQSEVQIMYDSASIPHIRAGSDHDLYLAQGYVTAQHRLWQMEFQTMAAAGRLSEIVGADALSHDRNQRRKGLVFGAQNSLAEIEKSIELKQQMEAYSAGVNAYIQSLEYKDLPIEYKLLDYKPEVWSPYKSALLLKYMADMLSGGDVDVENTNALTLLGRELFDVLYPDYYNGISPVIPSSQQWNQDIQKPDKPNITFPLQLQSQTTEKPEPNLGSNNWAVSGSKTASGKPILANDPHLGLNLPSIWYAMQLQSPSVNVMGATLTGALGIVIGFNDSIAWGVTNATRDVRDWYKINFRDEQLNEYKYDDEWRKTIKVLEEIKIRGKASYVDTLIFTHYGPVVFDKSYNPDHSLRNFALRWTAHDGANEQLALLNLNRATNYSEYTQAISTFDCPAQNFVFASASGDIALWVQGKFVNKWQEQGKFLLDGSDSRFEWQGYIPQKDNAHTLNPPRGFVSSANQHPTDNTYPYYVYDHSYENHRSRRINQKLEQLSSITVQDMMRLQNDNYNLKAAETLPILIASIDPTQLNSDQVAQLKLLENWNHISVATSVEGPAYELWWNIFYRKLWKDIGEIKQPIRWPNSYITTQLLQDFENSLFNDEDTARFHASLSQLATESFIKMSDSLQSINQRNGNTINWGMYKKSSILHLARLEPLSLTHLMIDGDRGIVNANSGRHGASWRMVVELGDTVKAWGIYPGGQSGNPGNPHYTHFVERWRTGQYLPLTFLKKTENGNAAIVFTQTLKVE